MATRETSTGERGTSELVRRTSEDESEGRVDRDARRRDFQSSYVTEKHSVGPSRGALRGCLRDTSGGAPRALRGWLLEGVLVASGSSAGEDATEPIDAECLSSGHLRSPARDLSPARGPPGRSCGVLREAPSTAAVRRLRVTCRARGEDHEKLLFDQFGDRVDRGTARRGLVRKNERDALVEHSVKFSIITRKGRALARIGGQGWKEHDGAVLEHRSKSKSKSDLGRVCPSWTPR